MNDEVQDEFNRGVNDYWGGELPEYWNHPEIRVRSPYLTGWYMASMWETCPGWVVDEDGDPLQDESGY